VGFGQAQMPPPPGYDAGQMQFDDQFLTTTLDSTKWNPGMYAEGTRWYDPSGPGGGVPAPYSTGGSTTTEAAYFDPAMLNVNNGLTVTCRRTVSGDYGYGSWPWVSGCISSMGKYTLPTTGWYTQYNVQMVDTSQGMWPAMWYLGATNSSPAEFDGFEGGWTGGNPTDNYQGHSDWFGNDYQPTWSTSLTGASPGTVDMTAGFNRYGHEFLPNVGGGEINVYFTPGSTGVRSKVWSTTTAKANGYCILVELQMAASTLANFHTHYSGTTPSPYLWKIAEVQAYTATPVAGNSAQFAIGFSSAYHINASGATLVTPFALSGHMTAAGTEGGGANISANFALNSAMNVLGEVPLSANFTLGGAMTADVEPPAEPGYVDIVLQGANVSITLQ
jgi:hypothetical protein